MIRDYNGQPLAVGDTVKNIESGWRGVIQDIVGEGVDVLLVCLGVYWLTGEVEADNQEWHAQYDVIKQRQQAPEFGETPAPGNFL